MDIERRELTKEDLLRMNIPARYWTVTFGGVHCSHAFEYVKRYLKRMDEMFERGIGLMFWGDNGRGKTCLAVLLGMEFRRRGHSVLFFETADLKHAVFNREKFDEELFVWDRVRSVDVLILDDVGKGVQDATGAGARLLDELIRYRNARKGVTFVTTNMSPGAQLGSELKKSTMETFKECIYPIEIAGPNQRDLQMSDINELLRGDNHE